MTAFVFVVLLLSLVRDQRAYLANEVGASPSGGDGPGRPARHRLRVDQRGSGPDGLPGRRPAPQRRGCADPRAREADHRTGALAAAPGRVALVHLRLQPRRLRGRVADPGGAAGPRDVRRVRRRGRHRPRRHHRAAPDRGAGELRRCGRPRPEESARRGPGLDRGGRGRHGERPEDGHGGPGARTARHRPDGAGDRGLAHLQRRTGGRPPAGAGRAAAGAGRHGEEPPRTSTSWCVRRTR